MFTFYIQMRLHPGFLVYALGPQLLPRVSWSTAKPSYARASILNTMPTAWWVKHIYKNGKTRPQNSQRYETSPTCQVVLTNLYLRVWRKPTAHLQSISCQHSISFYKSWNLVLQHPRAPVAGIVLMSVSPLRSVVPCQIHTAATHIQKVGKQCWRTVSVLILPSGKHCRVQGETASTELRKKLGRYYTNQPKPPHHSWTAAWAVNGHAPMSFCIGMHTATLQIFNLQLLLLAPSQEVRRSWSYIHTPFADDSTPNTTFHTSWIMSKPLLSAFFREWSVHWHAIYQ